MIESFEVSVPDASTDDFPERLARTRWPDDLANEQWRDVGTFIASQLGHAHPHRIADVHLTTTGSLDFMVASARTT